MSAKICSKCNTENPAEANYCRCCGIKLVEKPIVQTRDGSINKIGDTNKSSSTNTSLWFFLILFISTTIILGITLANSFEALEREQRKHTNLENQIQDMESELQQKKRDLNELNSYFSDIPFVITDVKVANTDKDGTIETDYGYRIYSSNTMYLKPKIKYIGLSSGNRKLRVKLFDSYGNLSKGTYQNKPSPDDCSYADDFYFSKGKNECNLVGWGNENKGHWQRGEYRFEIWYNNKCQYSKSFTIY